MSDSSGTWPWAVGTLLGGRYKLDVALRGDSQTALYRATDTRSQRLVCVEALKDAGIDLRGPGRFEQSLLALRALDHPNIAAILDYGLHQQRRYLVLDWLEGESLQQRLARGPLATEAALAIIRQLLAALASVHAVRLVHGNLSPSSVFVQRLRHGLERVKLARFRFTAAGVVPVNPGAPASAPPITTLVPAPPAPAGSSAVPPSSAGADERACRAPELLKHEPPTARSDVFAVGAMLTEMLASQATRSKVAASLSSVLGPAATPSESSLDPAMQALLQRATAADPSQRFADAAELLCALIDALPRAVNLTVTEQAAQDPASGSVATSVSEHAGIDTSPGPLLAADASQAASQLVPTLDLTSLAPVVNATSTAPAPRSRSRKISPLLAAGAGALLLMLGAYVLSVGSRGAPDERAQAPSRSAASTQVAASTAAAQPGRTEVSAITAAASPAALGASVLQPSAAKPMATTPVSAPALSPAAAPNADKPARNPWLEAVPAGLQGVPAYVATGGRGDEAMVRALRDYGRDNPDDPRGYLLLGRLYFNRLWRADCVAIWTLALRRDPSARGAPEVLPALVQLVAQGKDAAAAATLIATTYGREAEAAIEAGLAPLKNTEAGARLRDLQVRIAAGDPG